MAKEETVNPMWTPPKYPANAERVELVIMGDPDNTDYLYELIREIEMPFDGFPSFDYFTCIYTSMERAAKVIEQLYTNLCAAQPKLIGHPEGISIEDGVLYFKDCEVFVV